MGRTRHMLVTGMAGALLAAACGGSDDGRDDATANGALEDQTSEDASLAAGDEVAGIDEAALQAILDEWLSDVGAFGATLSVRMPGLDDIHLASGVDDRTLTARTLDGREIQHTESPMATGGTFPAQHVTKTFVTAAALQLVDEGLLSLDEPVDEWLPELPQAHETTLAMLLGYTSGLSPWWNDLEPTVIEDPTRAFTPDELLAEYLAEPPIAPPGEETAFGGVGFIAAGVLIERILDQDLATVIHERFTAPLSLNDTAVSDGSMGTRHGWLTFPGVCDPDRECDTLDHPGTALMTALWAERGMLSSSGDMLEWGEALFRGDVLGEEMTRTMLAMNPAEVPPVPNRYFGLGATGYCLDAAAACDPEQVELVGAPGSTSYGWSNQLVHHPESRVTIFVQANIDVDLPSQVLEPALATINELGVA